MNVGKTDEEESDASASNSVDLPDNYEYLGVEAGYTLATPLGSGKYRVMYLHTSNDFINADATQAENLSGVLLSFDQSLGDSLGAFIRFGSSRNVLLSGTGVSIQRAGHQRKPVEQGT